MSERKPQVVHVYPPMEIPRIINLAELVRALLKSWQEAGMPVNFKVVKAE